VVLICPELSCTEDGLNISWYLSLKGTKKETMPNLKKLEKGHGIIAK
jgi:hypothetical protein